MNLTGNYTISVIILSYNRSYSLRRLLDALLSQDIDPQGVEIIISDDGSEDDTAEAISEFQRKNKNIRFLRNGRLGVANSRNKGIEAAVNRLIVFLADDYMISEDFLSNIVSVFKQTDADILKVGLEWPDSCQFLARPGHLYNDYIFRDLLKRARLEYIADSSVTSLFSVNNFNDSTRCVFKKDVFKKTGKYLLYKRGEDIEFARRIRKNSFKIYYCPYIKIRHLHSYEFFDVFRYYFTRGREILAIAGCRSRQDKSFCYAKYLLRYLQNLFVMPLNVIRVSRRPFFDAIHLPFLIFAHLIFMCGVLYYAAFNDHT